MNVLLDTDHFTLLQRDLSKFPHLEARLDALAKSEIHVSIISFQEQVRGWLNWINTARTPKDLIRGFRQLQLLIDDYSKVHLLPFGDKSLVEYEALKRQRIRIGTSDLRIAAIALVHGATVLTRNLRDFRQVPGLVAEDWTLP